MYMYIDYRNVGGRRILYWWFKPLFLFTEVMAQTICLRRGSDFRARELNFNFDFEFEFHSFIANYALLIIQISISDLHLIKR